MLIQKEGDIEVMLQYHECLLQRYPAELTEMYVPAFERCANRAANRKDYESLVFKIKKVIKDIPSSKEKMVALVLTLKQKYPRRPAMLEELNRVK